MLDLVDTHCHLDIAEFDSEREDLIARCQAGGMRGILVPGVVAADWDNLRVVCSRYSLLWPAFGLHPCYCGEHRAEHLQALEGYLQSGAVAVGEIGLDTFHGDQDFASQLDFFAAQVAIAKNHRLPLVLHARKTHDQILKVLRQQHFEHGGSVHAFSGSLQQAERFVEMGFGIGFGGGATYERANKIRGILQKIPLDNVLLETDSPDISPSFARGERNTPFNLFRITEILAGVLEMPAQELAAHSTANALRVFLRSGA